MFDGIDDPNKKASNLQKHYHIPFISKTKFLYMINEIKRAMTSYFES